MRQLRRWMMVLLCCAAAAARGEAPPDARQQEARTALGEARRLWDAGRYADAIARGEHALALREAVLGGSHPDVAECLDLLGLHHLRQGNPVRAEPLLQRALAIREAALGPNHPEVAQTLTTLANLYLAQEFTLRPSRSFRALAIREAALGKHHPLVAEPLNNLAILYRAQRLYTQAEPLMQRALAIREAALGKDHPDVATRSTTSPASTTQGLYGRAEPLYRARARHPGSGPRQEPSRRRRLAQQPRRLYESQGLYARAEPLYAARARHLGSGPRQAPLPTSPTRSTTSPSST